MRQGCGLRAAVAGDRRSTAISRRGLSRSLAARTGILWECFVYVEVMDLKKRGRWGYVFVLPAVLLFLLVYGIPLVTVFVTSLFDYRIFPDRFEFIGFGNYVKLFCEDPAFWQALTNTVIWLLLQCTVHVALGVLAALVLAKKPRGWKAVRVCYMIPNIISASAVGMIFINFYNPEFGILNSLLRLAGLESLQHNWLFDMATAFPAVTMTWLLFAGYTMTLVLAEILSVPESIFEAARVDGATGIQMDIHITLPLVKNIIATSTVMAATYMLQMFVLLYVTTKGGPSGATTNLPLYLYKTALLENNYGYANTMGVFIILIGIAIMTAINRVFGVGKGER